MQKEASWDGKTRGGYLGYKIFYILLKTFGVGFAYFILIFVAFYFFFFSPKSTSANYFYFRKIQGYSRIKSILSIFKLNHNFGQTILDKVAVLSGSDKFSHNSTGAENLFKIVDQNAGGLLISAHLGNWEIAGHFLKGKLGVPINIVLFDGEHQNIKNMLDKVMKERQVKIIPIKQDMSHLFLMKKAMDNNEIICIHGDRFKVEHKHKTAVRTFMGRDAIFPKGPFELAARLKIPYSFVFAVKKSMYEYDFFATETKIGSDADIILDEYVKSLELKIKDYPTQWYNFYKFWKV